MSQFTYGALVGAVTPLVILYLVGFLFYAAAVIRHRNDRNTSTPAWQRTRWGLIVSALICGICWPYVLYIDWGRR